MKKLVSLAALTAILSGCADLSSTGSSNASYGTEGFGEEPLVATATPSESLNDAYLFYEIL